MDPDRSEPGSGDIDTQYGITKVCFYCGAHFSNYQRLAEHLLQHHNNERVTIRLIGKMIAFRCWCGQSYRTIQGMGDHLATSGGMRKHIIPWLLGSKEMFSEET